MPRQFSRRSARKDKKGFSLLLLVVAAPFIKFSFDIYFLLLHFLIPSFHHNHLKKYKISYFAELCFCYQWWYIYFFYSNLEKCIIFYWSTSKKDASISQYTFLMYWNANLPCFKIVCTSCHEWLLAFKEWKILFRHFDFYTKALNSIRLGICVWLYSFY